MNYICLFSDLHSNIHHDQIEYLDEWYQQAREMLDFWAIAYYPYYIRNINGMPVEDILSIDKIQEDWNIINKFVIEKNKCHPEFPVFLGYEWQGAGLDGDHNVFFKDIGPIVNPMRYIELYKELSGYSVITIPHHLAYSLSHRGKNWATQIDEFSPLAEIYSSHGSSESADTDLPMARHIHMGPRSGGTSVFDGLICGNKVGIIASGDNHIVPAQYGHGFAGILSRDTSKEEIWYALNRRRVYGMTSGRVKLLYEINGNIMGSEFKTTDKILTHHIKVETQDSIDRIVIYKNGKPHFTYNYAEKWVEKPFDAIVKFKFKLEFGWGPDLNTYPDTQERIWNGSLRTNGFIKSIEKCWSSFGQSLNLIDSSYCTFKLTTKPASQTGKWMGQSSLSTEGFVFEIEAPINSDIVIEVDGQQYIKTVNELLESADVIVLLDESKKLAKEVYGLNEFYRSDPFYHNAYKVRISKAKTQMSYIFDKKFKLRFNESSFYLIKVYQSDGSVAWSSPIWVNRY